MDASTVTGRKKGRSRTNDSLVDLRPGETAAVRCLEGNRSFVARLAALGFTIGAPVKVVRRREHGPFLVSLRGTRVALGYEEAKRILARTKTAAEQALAA